MKNAHYGESKMLNPVREEVGEWVANWSGQVFLQQHNIPDRVYIPDISCTASQW